MKLRENKILITGSDGQLGREFFNLTRNSNKYLYFFTDKNTLDICSLEQLEKFVITNKINIIINCAAYTNVEQAEEEISCCMKINNFATLNLSKVCKQYNVGLIHFSTDFVFDGKKKSPYVEEDKLNPLSQYGLSKKMGEENILKINPSKSLIIRTSWLYSQFGSNFVKTILQLKNNSTTKIVDDQIGSPTSTRSLVECILKIIPRMKNSDVEIYHYSNKGECTWFDFASHIYKFTYGESKICPVSSKEYKQKAIRPNYGVLCCDKIRNDYGIVIPSWENELKNVLSKLNF